APPPPAPPPAPPQPSPPPPPGPTGAPAPAAASTAQAAVTIPGPCGTLACRGTSASATVNRLASTAASAAEGHDTPPRTAPRDPASLPSPPPSDAGRNRCNAP